jgi:hypothetical protein
MNVVPEEGQIVCLSDGRRYKLIWSGLLGEASSSTFTRLKNGTLTAAFLCHSCKKTFAVGEPYYNRKGPGMNRKSSYYCLGCAETLGLIEAEAP